MCNVALVCGSRVACWRIPTQTPMRDIVLGAQSHTPTQPHNFGPILLLYKACIQRDGGLSGPLRPLLPAAVQAAPSAPPLHGRAGWDPSRPPLEQRQLRGNPGHPRAGPSPGLAPHPVPTAGLQRLGRTVLPGAAGGVPAGRHGGRHCMCRPRGLTPDAGQVRADAGPRAVVARHKVQRQGF